MSHQITNIPINQIIPGDNDRQTFNQADLLELADSIGKHGLAQPITVRPIQNGIFEIVAGERRFRAISTILTWATIPAIVRELSDEQAAAIMLAENVHRVDLNPMDEARAYDRRRQQFGWTIAELSQQANVSRGRIVSRLKLMDLAPEIQDLVAHGHLALGNARAISKLNHAFQRQALTWLKNQTGYPTARVFNRIVDDLYKQQIQTEMFDLNSLLMAVPELDQETPPDPPRPGQDIPPADGQSAKEIITNQVGFWTSAAAAWNALGKAMYRRECAAAAAALSAALFAF